MSFSTFSRFSPRSISQNARKMAALKGMSPYRSGSSRCGKGALALAARPGRPCLIAVDMAHRDGRCRDRHIHSHTALPCSTMGSRRPVSNSQQLLKRHNRGEISVRRHDRRQRSEIDKRHECRHPFGSLDCGHLAVHLVNDSPRDFPLSLYLNEAKRLPGLDKQIDLTPLPASLRA